MLGDLTYESNSCTMEACAAALSAALGTTFAERESDYLGGLYLKSRGESAAAKTLKIVTNAAFYDDRPLFSDRAKDATLVLAEGVLDRDALDAILFPLGFLRPGMA